MEPATIRGAVKILLACVYWPPAGGPGVVRPLKLSGHLAELGFEVHVLAPDDPKWVHRDPTLRAPAGVAVHRTRNPGPPAARWLDLPGTTGLARLRLLARLNARRVSVPDAAVYWSLGSVRAALRLVAAERIDVLLTTSPPISVNLLGAAVKARARIPWVADLRDSPLTPDRRRHVRGERWIARLVARRADAIVTATNGIAEEMRAFGPSARVTTIENAADFDDFAGLEYRRGDTFRVTHTGSFVGRRDAGPFLDALARAEGVVARFVGDFPPADPARLNELGLDGRVERVPYLSRAETLAEQRSSDALLLLLPDTGRAGRGILTTKLFEYLAAGRPILAVVQPDSEAAALVREAGAGVVVPPGDVDGIAGALDELHRRWLEGDLPGPELDPERRRRLDRRERAERLAALLRKVAA